MKVFPRINTKKKNSNLFIVSASNLLHKSRGILQSGSQAEI